MLRLKLDEPLDRLGQLPNILVDPTVNYRWFQESGRLDRLVYLALGGSGCEGNQQQVEDRYSHETPGYFCQV
jgi:hypothetical protein